MRKPIHLIIVILFVSAALLSAAEEKTSESDEALVRQRLTYESEAKDACEYWAKGAQSPQINGTPVNLNPAKTCDSPFLSMEHGENKSVIHYPCHKDEVLDFGCAANPEGTALQSAPAP